MNLVDELLMQLVKRNGSDLHLIAGDPPRMRLNGELTTVRDSPLEPDQLQEQLGQIVPSTAASVLNKHDQADFAHEVEGLARFRVNVFRHLGGLGAIMRAIPTQAKTIEELGLPDVIGRLCKETSGLILVTGKTGSGKSTTLAAMLDDINRRMKGHILTIEDPIEFVHPRRNCLVSQREVGLHSGSFSEALHSALREDPDVILVGELRDLETMSTAITAAEMGILVMGTLHTNGAAQTVDRIVNAFPSERQSHIRTMISTSMRGVISQQLCRKKTGDGRVPAFEVMVNTPAVSNLLRQGKLDQLESAMQAGAKVGMITMDSALQSLLDRRFITGREAYERAISKDRFRQHADES
ncbi:MAG: type IV pilus twitching motility protein PilT [Gammaproteobacteria bacterium]